MIFLTLNELVGEFVKIYGGSTSDIRVFSSPGRVNLIGEHTHYNGGYVLPAAVSMHTNVAVRINNSDKINIAATDLKDRAVLDTNLLNSYKELKWGNYQAGVAYILKNNGYNILGCDILFDDTIPHEAGLSSSAAIELSTAYALAVLSSEHSNNIKQTDLKELAVLCQRAESEYCGVNSGIMDQMTSALGLENNALFIDCKSLEFRYIPIRLNEYKIIIANTNKKRSNSKSIFKERQDECERALAELKRTYPDAECLRDISVTQFERVRASLYDDTLRIRAEHVVYECDRVLKAAEALEKGDIVGLGKLMTTSHISLRDLYEITSFELDTLVEEAIKVEGCMGSRMTGEGIGGCTVSIVATASVDKFIETVSNNYIKKTGLIPQFYVVSISDGTKEISLINPT